MKIDEADILLLNLQKAEDDYYLTANYLLKLANCLKVLKWSKKGNF